MKRLRLERTIDISREEQTTDYARQLAPSLQAGVLVALVGELGAGKTALVRHLVAALGISCPVSSPSYVLMHEYQVPENKLRVEHWDLYRLSLLPEELREPPAANTLRLVEWADKFPEFAEEADVRIEITTHLADGELVRRLHEYRRCL